MKPADLWGIQDVANELGVTHRTLRFYEDKGLISPQRIGSTRVYTRRDLGRMKLILRGKRLGFSLREISEFLELYEVDADQHHQIEALLERVRTRLEDLKNQRKAIEETIRELSEIEKESVAFLARG
ncbi:MerR family transcriptional regulator [Altererythrobacter salegens]|uniref:MerR family transcriptional regulator n=1 Tax=Croceibacterium salegens TaxID=1737568 RepID=A0A6I4SRF3_9SPHN|nr:MerR family DNA-binding transcriptional regulator [Croceibacterium salegens]MXO58454.1 MerR family transcriptional regulator [Croceibacterium salegens]